MKYTGPKAKICRRFGINIYGADKYDKVLQHKPQPAGKGPRDRLGRKSEYATQLLEKQKVRLIYGLSEKQFRRIYEESSKSKVGPTGDMIKQFLERRSDNVIYRAGFAMTRMQSRQFISHGLFLLNGRRITIPSYRVKVGDVLTLRTKNANSQVFNEIVAAHEKLMPPGWMKVDSSKFSIEIIAIPESEMAEQAIDVRQVIEFYSRN
ncbi:MAG: 30S ribosomal protein S4 [Candidatus Peribacteraceae bacterium]|nr:30S ribosomal protein S4 [Candidatus Peribacteraceae bacterium]